MLAMFTRIYSHNFCRFHLSRASICVWSPSDGLLDQFLTVVSNFGNSSTSVTWPYRRQVVRGESPSVRAGAWPPVARRESASLYLSESHSSLSNLISAGINVTLRPDLVRIIVYKSARATKSTPQSGAGRFPPDVSGHYHQSTTSLHSG